MRISKLTGAFRSRPAGRDKATSDWLLRHCGIKSDEPTRNGLRHTSNSRCSSGVNGRPAGNRRKEGREGAIGPGVGEAPALNSGCDRIRRSSGKKIIVKVVTGSSAVI